MPLQIKITKRTIQSTSFKKFRNWKRKEMKRKERKRKDMKRKEGKRKERKKKEKTGKEKKREEKRRKEKIISFASHDIMTNYLNVDHVLTTC